MSDGETPPSWLEIAYWREPDKFTQYRQHCEAVWYGPGGSEGENATQVMLSEDEFIFTEYTWDENTFDDRNPEGGAYLMQQADYDAGIAKRLIMRAIAHHNEQSLPAQRLRVPRGPKEVARIFASIGSSYVGYYGGEEDTAVSLP